MKNRKSWIIAAVVLLLVTLPYVYAFAQEDSNSVFGGFLVNPLDGNTYLAKMYQGWEGGWTFTLPYSASPGPGAFLFLFYIFLGHVAAWLGLPLLLVFHLARLMAVVLMLIAIERFFSLIFEDEHTQFIAFILAAFGSGLGWLFYPLFGQLTPDLWVAEAYPFLSAYSNPHFPFSIALILFLAIQALQPTKLRRFVSIVLSALLLSIIQPYGVVIAGIIFFAVALNEWLRYRQIRWKMILGLLLGGVPMLIYEYSLTLTDPALANWHSQNLTISPNPILVLIGFSPVIIFAFFGAWVIFHQKVVRPRALVIWMILGLGLLYLPLTFQRRFMTLLYLPICAVSAVGINEMARGSQRRLTWITSLTIALSVPTLILLIVSGTIAASKQDPSIYLNRGEVDAYSWIRENTNSNVIILASSNEGLYIPAYTGRKVIYGHPYETIDAKKMESWVDSCFSKPSTTQNAEMVEKNISFIFYGPREKLIGDNTAFKDMPIVYQNSSVTIYSVTNKSGS